MKWLIPLTILLTGLAACAAPAPVSTGADQANMPNPASVFCEERGYKSEIRTAADGSQSGVCLFPDGSSCDEWAYFRAECGPASQKSPTLAPTAEVNTPVPTSTAAPVANNPADYQGWWTYTHTVYHFTIMLPEDWIVEEISANDPLMNGHTLSLHPKNAVGIENIRMTFRRAGEETMLWPSGVGQGEFMPQGTLAVAGQPAQRVLLVCPGGEVSAIWYQQGQGQANIARGDMEFGFIFKATPLHCEAGHSLNGKVQRLGEMILASLSVQ